MRREGLMRNVVFAGAAVAAILGSSPGQADTAAFITGKDYRAMTDSERTAYVSAASDMMNRMCELVDSGSVDFCNRVARCTGSMNNRQLRDFVDSYMNDGTKDDYGMASDFRAAMNTNCPQ